MSNWICIESTAITRVSLNYIDHAIPDLLDNTCVAYFVILWTGRPLFSILKPLDTIHVAFILENNSFIDMFIASKRIL